MLQTRVARRRAAAAVLVALAAAGSLLAWWLVRRPFLDRWGTDAVRLVSPERIGRQIEVLSKKPHRAGTPANAEVASEVERRLAAAGLKPWSDVHEADLWEPVVLKLALAGPGGQEIDLREPGPPADAAAGAREERPFLAYAPDADVEAPLVYANAGASEDYDALRKAGVDPRGKAALVHGRGACAGEKVAAAERAGVAALLVYAEPAGSAKAPAPGGPGAVGAGAPRGSLLKSFRRPGDPRRAKEQGADVLPRIPALSLPSGAAETLLRAIAGPEAPAGWKGALDAPYVLGPGRRVRVTVRGKTVRARLRNVLASIPGADPKAPPVLVMAHYDAWGSGALDPGAGAAAVLEAAEVLSGLASRGWTPERGVLFALWDGEEWGMLGSTAWVEAHLGGAGLPVAAALNVDAAAREAGFDARATPGLGRVLGEALARVADPLAPAKTLRDAAREPALPGFSSDAAPFLGFTAVPVADLGFGPADGVSDSSRDTADRVAKVSDPGFARSAALARAAVLLAGALATPRVFPFAFPEAAAYLDRELRELRARHPAATGWLPNALRSLQGRLETFDSAAAAWDAFARSRKGGTRARTRADEIAGLAIASLGTPGTFGRGCLLWGPSEATGCAGAPLPALDEAVRRGDRGTAVREAERLGGAVSRARDYLVAGDWVGRGHVRERPAPRSGPERN